MLVIIISNIMKKLSEEIPSGYYLAKLEIKGDDFSKEDLSEFKSFSANIVKKKNYKDSEFILCKGESLNKDNKKIKIKFSLMKSGKNNNLKKNYIKKLNLDNILYKYDHSFTFTKVEVEEFCNYVGDKNEIHMGEKPVVPGMFILHKLEKYLEKAEVYTLKNTEVVFQNPVFVNDRVFIKNNGKNIEGISEGEVSFIVKFLEEEKNE